jgi:hypothetical protein
MENSIIALGLSSNKIEPINSPKSSVKKTSKNVSVKKAKTKTMKNKCPKGKRRNPKTQRCRIKCKPKFRRNKTTHRCKKIKTVVKN